MLIPVHRSRMPVYSESKEEHEKIAPIKKNQSIWTPINRNFFTDESEDENQNEVSTHIAKFDDIEVYDENQLEWDDDEQHIQLGHTPPAIESSPEEALQPRRLFAGNTDEESITTELTEESSNDEVFFPNTNKPQQSKLQRRNAIRRPKRTPNSEPRITREMIKSNRYEPVSCPTTPSRVILKKTQNLENVLKQRKPLVPESVNMKDNTVQTLTQALNVQAQDDDKKRRERPIRSVTKQKMDYLHLHKYGRQ